MFRFLIQYDPIQYFTDEKMEKIMYAKKETYKIPVNKGFSLCLTKRKSGRRGAISSQQLSIVSII